MACGWLVMGVAGVELATKRVEGEKARNTQDASNKINVCMVLLATFSDILKETDKMSLEVVKPQRKKKGNTNWLRKRLSGS